MLAVSIYLYPFPYAVPSSPLFFYVCCYRKRIHKAHGPRSLHWWVVTFITSFQRFCRCHVVNTSESSDSCTTPLLRNRTQPLLHTHCCTTPLLRNRTQLLLHTPYSTTPLLRKLTQPRLHTHCCTTPLLRNLTQPLLCMLTSQARRRCAGRDALESRYGAPK